MFFQHLHNVSKTRDSVLNFQLHSVFLCAQTKQPNFVFNTCLIHCLRENSTFVNLSTCKDLFRKLSRSIQKLLDHSIKIYSETARPSVYQAARKKAPAMDNYITFRQLDKRSWTTKSIWSCNNN